MLIREAESAELVSLIHELFVEYAASLHIDLYLYGFNQELLGLPGPYARPDGRLLVAFEGDEAAGCIALKKLNDISCEMKRLYVRPKFRGQPVGGCCFYGPRFIGYTGIHITCPGCRLLGFIP